VGTQEPTPVGDTVRAILGASLLLLALTGGLYLFFTNLSELSMLMLGQINGYERFVMEQLLHR
jgi:hypothetical protein